MKHFTGEFQFKTSDQGNLLRGEAGCRNFKISDGPQIR